MDRFDRERVEQFKTSLESWIEGMIDRQTEVSRNPGEMEDVVLTLQTIYRLSKDGSAITLLCDKRWERILEWVGIGMRPNEIIVHDQSGEE